MARVSKIVNHVIGELGVVGFPQADEAVVLHNLQETQRDLARRANAIEGDGILETVSGVEEYAISTGIHRLITLIEPVEWTQDIQVTMNARDWKQIKRDTSLTTGATQPLYAFFWNNQVRLYPAPDAIYTVEWLAYIAPTLELVIDGAGAGQSDDPEVDAHWDDALMLGTMYRMVRFYAMTDPRLQSMIVHYKALYEEEVERQDMLEINRYLGEPHTRQSSQESQIGGGNILGF